MAGILRQLPGVPVSWADDVIILCRTEDEAETAKAQLSAALMAVSAGPLRPRILSIKNTSRGFPFLGYNIRRGFGAVYSSPIKRNWRTIEARLRTALMVFAKSGDEKDREDAVRAFSQWIAQFPNWHNGGMCLADKKNWMEMLNWSPASHWPMQSWCEGPADRRDCASALITPPRRLCKVCNAL